MTARKSDSSTDDHDRRIAHGAGVNALGILGRAAMPAFLVLVTRLYGPELMGIFYLATRLVEAAFNLTVSGFNDGVLMFASRYADDEDKQDHLYRVMANGFVVSLGVAGLLVLAAFTVGPVLLPLYNDWEELPAQVATLSVALPFMPIPVLVVAATRSLQIMRWDAILFGTIQPLLLLALTVIAWLLDLGLSGLMWSYVLTNVVMSVIAIRIFQRYFDLGRLVRAMIRLRPFGPLVSFAIPQNLNMTFGRVVTDLDVLMLGYFGASASAVAFYGIGAQIVRNIRQIKLAFSGSFSPVIARYHAAGRFDDLSNAFSTVTRWTTTAVMPVAAVVILMRSDLLLIFHETFDENSTFMVLLAVVPVMSCLFGLAGNILVMTGHSRWNLFNSLVIGGLNFFLNYLLIPPYGLFGAALATLIASVVHTSMQMAQVRYLMGVRLKWHEVWRPYAAALPVLLLAIGATLMGAEQSFSLRVTASLLSVALFVGSLYVLGLPERDKAIFLFWRRARPLSAP